MRAPAERWRKVPAASALRFPAAAFSQVLTVSDAIERQHAHQENEKVFTAKDRKAQRLREQVARLEEHTRLALATIERQASDLAARSPWSPSRSSAESSRPFPPRSGRGRASRRKHTRSNWP